MNEQRSRRYNTAKTDARKKMNASQNSLDRTNTNTEVEIFAESTKKKKKGGGHTFDTNSITPGTEFMVNLDKEIRNYITKRLKQGQNPHSANAQHWKNLRVIHSGYQTPGEGEHKIADYIRYIRSMEPYNGQIKHCIYGLDADLLHLALVSNESEMYLLREENVAMSSGKKDSKITSTFIKVNIQKLRTEIYNDSYKNNLPSSSPINDIYRLTDDWVFLNFVVGNDFIPETPKNAGSGKVCEYHANFKPKDVPEIAPFHVEAVKKTGKYLINDGKICVETFIEFLKLLVVGSGSDEARFDFYRDRFEELKNENFNYEKPTESLSGNEIIKNLCKSYLRSISWITDYYFNGIKNWSVFYEYHHTPFLADVLKFLQQTNESDLKNLLTFKKDEPILPFEQLMMVLPPGSKNCIPKAYHDLMSSNSSSSSTISRFYPNESDFTNISMSKALPFINLQELQKAMNSSSCRKLLFSSEKERNKHLPSSIYSFEQVGNFSWEADKVNKLGDLPYCNFHYLLKGRDIHRIGHDKIRRGLIGEINLSHQKSTFSSKMKSKRRCNNSDSTQEKKHKNLFSDEVNLNQSASSASNSNTPFYGGAVQTPTQNYHFNNLVNNMQTTQPVQMVPVQVQLSNLPIVDPFNPDCFSQVPEVNVNKTQLTQPGPIPQQGQIVQLKTPHSGSFAQKVHELDQNKTLKFLTFTEIACKSGFGLLAEYVEATSGESLKISGFGSSKKGAKQDCCRLILERLNL